MVQWSGEDSTSGLAAYDVQVRVDGGAWQDWRVGVTETSGVYVGTLGHTYAFRSRGHDRAGNVEAWPAVPDAETRVVARVRKTYIFGGMPVAVRLLAQGEAAGLVVYLHLDHLGSPVVATDGGGGVVAEVRYYPYGGMRYQMGEMPTTLNFTGQRLDAGVGLLYYRARYYDPVLGRFIQPDTVVPEPGDPQSLNLFSYVLNNPLKHVDPSGQCIPGVNCPGDMGDVYVPPPPPPAHYALTKDPNKYVQSQGAGTNDCGPTSVAMGINVALGQPRAFTKEFVTDFMNQSTEVIEPFSGVSLGSTAPKYRWWAGATLPVQARDAINELAEIYDLPIHAESGMGTLDDLKSNLQKGYPTLVCVVWDNPWQAHWMVLEGYDEATDTWTFLDPAYMSGGPIWEWSTEEFLKYWERWYGGIDPFFHNKMVTIVVEEEVPSIE